MKLKINRLLVLLLALISQIALAQEKTVTGTVTDGVNPLYGVNILIKGTKNGISTNVDGKYSIKAKEGDVLVFSYLGMKEVIKTVGNANLINVTLQDDSKTLDQVVVTAMGIKKSSKGLGYSAQNVKSEEISKSGKSNVMDALNGKVSGVQITNAGGQAGGSTNVVIRGYSSITGNNQPLYVVDGVPIDNSSENTDATSTIGGTPAANRAIDISPDDVENVAVLKGGAATALYGIRAANGAIIITTKKGKQGKLNIEFSTNVAADTANKFPSFSDKFTTGSNGVFNSGTVNQWGPLSDSGALYPAGTVRDIDGDGVTEDISGTPIKIYKDNYKNFFKIGTTLKYTVAVSGGTDKNTFYTSISSLNQDGIVPNQNYKKNSFLFSGTQKFSDKFDMEAKVNYINSSGLVFNNSQLGSTLLYFNNNYDLANFPYQDSFANRTYWHPTLSSPMWTVNKTGENRNLDRFMGNIGFNYKLTSKLTLTSKLGIDHYTENRKNYNSIGTAEFSNTDYLGDITNIKISNTDINSDLFLRYDQKITDDWKLSAMVGNNFYHKEYDRTNNKGTSFILPDLIDIQNTKEKIITHNSYQKELVGAFGELNINYKNLLYLTATGRNDWASTLPKANNSFFYPSASMSFIFSELIDNKSFYGKLRGSYAGIANIPDPKSLETIYRKKDVNYFNNPAYTMSDTQNNAALKPESIKQWEIGTELGFLNNKINLEATYYNKKATDQIIYAPISNTTGFYDSLLNLGEIENKGIEATLRLTDLVTTKGLSWTTEFNFTRNRGMVNKVGENGLDQVNLANSYVTTAEIVAKKGYPLGAIYGYTYEHSNPNDKNSPLLVDANGNPLRSEQKSIIGNTNPDFILGLNTSASYKGFKAGFTIERKQGGQIVNDYLARMTFSGKSTITDNRYYTGASTEKATQNFNGVDTNGNPVNVAAKLDKNFYQNTYLRTDENFIEDASWWRLRNVYLGYSLPKKFLQDLHITGLEFTLTGRNLWLKTAYQGVDPEVNSLGSGGTGNGVIGIDALSIPNTKSIDFGVKVKL